ncbi:MAG: fructosamine kinase family protein, partial [Gammaproteobacteria bacterium]|nr:fructosamine kinase family protein [Gammaproteobacteria bacterium]
MLHDRTLEALNFSLQTALEPTVKIISAEPVSGGCINQTYKCQTNQNVAYFIKLNAANKLSMFEAEARGLDVLRGSQT